MENEGEIRKAIIYVIGIVNAMVAILCMLMFFIINNTIAYTPAPDIFSKTPKDTIFVTINHNPILGYIFISCSLISAIIMILNAHTDKKE